jgi:hypothetical protein
MSETFTQSPESPNGSRPEPIEVGDKPAANGDLQTEFDRESPPGMPRWVKMSALVFVLLFLMVAGLHLTGNAPTHGIPMHGMP